MRRIKLSKGMHALVDSEDFAKLSQWKWSASNESRGTKWYAIRFCRKDGKRAKIRMHRFLLGLGTGFEDARIVDHKNGDSLDNRKANLRITDQRTNMLYSPGWKRSSEVAAEFVVCEVCQELVLEFKCACPVTG